MTEMKPASVKGLVFDMDGLLLDSEKIVKRAWDYTGEQLGYKNFGNHIFRTVGFNLKRRTEYFRENVDPDFPMEFFADTARKKYHEIVREEGIEVKPGARELLEWAGNNGYRLGLATSSRKSHAEESLKRVGLFDFFDGMQFGDTVQEGKPHPEIYLKACMEIGICPNEAAALEDAPSGICAAAAAGMYVIAVPDLVEPPKEVEQYIWKRADSLLEVISLLQTVKKNKQ